MSDETTKTDPVTLLEKAAREARAQGLSVWIAIETVSRTYMEELRGEQGEDSSRVVDETYGASV